MEIKAKRQYVLESEKAIVPFKTDGKTNFWEWIPKPGLPQDGSVLEKDYVVHVLDKPAPLRIGLYDVIQVVLKTGNAEARVLEDCSKDADGYYYAERVMLFQREKAPPAKAGDS